MTYEEATEYLYNATPLFQKIGAAAYKPGLDTARRLDGMFGEPHRAYRKIHVAGTNGKGSTCHTLAAILQSAGYRVGLYTSPHLTDFRERIRVNGRMIEKEQVTDFVERYIAQAPADLSPSFFELTTIMAFEHFAKERVDVAAIETGLGGRLDTTNIIDPDLCVITNISFDHTAQLGNTLTAIAAEKAGIITPGVPTIVGNGGDEDVRNVFIAKSKQVESALTFADESGEVVDADRSNQDYINYTTRHFGHIRGSLTGLCQIENTQTILNAVMRLREMGYEIPDDAVRRGFAKVESLTGLAGRWMKIGEKPLRVCDTGHNVGGWEYLAQMLASHPGRLHMVIGFVNDKDVTSILRLMPRDAVYYFTRASIPRAMEPAALANKAAGEGLNGRIYSDVWSAYRAALANASPDDMIFIGGSTFVVADLLENEQKQIINYSI